MAHQLEPSDVVVHFHENLAKVVELGYGQDECERMVTVMFEDLVRQAVPCGQRDKLSFTLPLKASGKRHTYAHLLAQTTELVQFLESNPAARGRGHRRSPVVFPFLSTLGLAGGAFLLAFHLARLAPEVIRHAMAG
jgi:hypothetical protein